MSEKLGTIVHSVTSSEGTVWFPATDAWEATEVAPGGCEGAKEVIDRDMHRKNPHIFVDGAIFRSWHEETGECIWGGELPGEPVPGDIGLQVFARGWMAKAERKAGQLLYASDELDWMPESSDGTGPHTWDLSADGYDYLIAKRPQHNDTSGGAYGSGQWQTDNFSGGGAFFFDPGLDRTTAISRLRGSILKSGIPNGSATVLFKAHDIQPGSTTVRTLDAFVLSCDNGSYDVDIDLRNAEISSVAGYAVQLQIDVGNVSQSEPDLVTKYGVWPAFKPSCNAADYDGWPQGLAVYISNLRVNGIAKGDTYTLSAAFRDLTNRVRVRPSDIDEYGFNVLPLFFNEGETFAECLDYLSVLGNVRWLILDNGSHPYMDIGKFNKRVWEMPERNWVTKPFYLERFDRIRIPFRYPNSKRRGWVQVVADRPFEEPNGYGRLRLKGAHRDEEAAQSLGERVLPLLYKPRQGGSVDLAVVNLEGDSSTSPYFLHAGDVVRDPRKSARGRVQRKTMTKRAVRVDLESNYAPLDSLLAREAKRMKVG